MNIASSMHFDDDGFPFMSRVFFLSSILHLLFSEFAFGKISLSFKTPLRYYYFHSKHPLITYLSPTRTPHPGSQHQEHGSLFCLYIRLLSASRPIPYWDTKMIKTSSLKVVYSLLWELDVYRSDDNIRIKNWPRYRFTEFPLCTQHRCSVHTCRIVLNNGHEAFGLSSKDLELRQRWWLTCCG